MYDDTVTFCKTCDVCQKCNKGKKFVGRMSYLEVKELTERFNRTMTAWLTKKLEGIHTRWEDVLPALMWEYNSTVHSMTGFTPALLALGREIRSPLDQLVLLPEKFDLSKWTDSGIPTLIEHVTKAVKEKKQQQEERTKKFNDEKRERFPTFVNPGTKVLMEQERQTDLDKQQHEKLIPLYVGPFEVVRVHSEDASFVVQVGAEEKTVRAERIKLYRERPERLRPKKEIGFEDAITEVPEEPLQPTDLDYVPDQKTQEEIQETREKDERKFRVGDKVGVYFDLPGVTDGRNWFCGVILKTETRKNRAFVKFLDGSDEDWYPMNNEMRHCPDHQCGEEPCLLISEIGIRVGSHVNTPKGRGVVVEARDDYVHVKFEKEKWPMTFGRDEIFPVIPEPDEDLRRKIREVKRRSRRVKKKTINSDRSGTR
jgi:hypothetical protein